MHPRLLADLGASGLVPGDIRVREVGPPELAATSSPSSLAVEGSGYVIPYYDIHGDPIPFYRVKLLDHSPGYKQPKGSQNHVYFPPTFASSLKEFIKSRGSKAFIILTEGEKKAVATIKAGFPSVALGGVDSWRNRVLILPEGTVLESTYGKKKVVRAKLPSVALRIPEVDTLAIGMQDLIDTVLDYKLVLIIVFDTDLKGKIRFEVQRAASMLGHELRHRGVPLSSIRQIMLPNEGTSKTGLDDFLLAYSAKDLDELIEKALQKRCAFPRHPSLKSFIGAKLESGKVSRRDAQNISMSIVVELDARGRRLRSEAIGLPYFFDEKTHHLMDVALLQHYSDPLHESPFGSFLYREFGISSADSKIITWLAAQFTGEDPIEDVVPRRVLSLIPDRSGRIAYQVSDSLLAVVSSDPEEPLVIKSNGSEGILFVRDQVNPLDPQELLDAFHRFRKKPLEPWWLEVFGKMDLSGGEQQEILASLLFYISPWLNRWKGVQLPVEILTGEAGSGKSSLYNLRLNILTGRPFLRNLPADLRDWHASVANSGGLHVTDNVQFTSKDLKQKVSDEICRLITEPSPRVEMRRLYTTVSQVQVPVHVAFALTSIQQPFYGADLIQRAAVFELQALSCAHDGDWVEHQLEERGGRTSWVAHHLVAIHHFLNLALTRGKWDSRYQAKHRLAHYEQCLKLMAEVLHLEVAWLPEALTVTTKALLSEADWALEGLRTFAEDTAPGYGFTATDIALWAQLHEEFNGNMQLTNARRLGRYMQSHKRIIEETSGIREVGVKGNRRLFDIKKSVNG